MNELITFTFNEKVFAVLYFENGFYCLSAYFRSSNTLKFECNEDYEMIRNIYNMIVK